MIVLKIKEHGKPMVVQQTLRVNSRWPVDRWHLEVVAAKSEAGVWLLAVVGGWSLIVGGGGQLTTVRWYGGDNGTNEYQVGSVCIGVR